MPMSSYVRDLRDRAGHRLLLLPGVTAVVAERGRVLLVRQRDTARWSLVGGGVEPGEEPRDAVEREVREELGVTPVVLGIVGAYGGPDLTTVLPNGDEVGYVTVAYRCSLPGGALDLELELGEVLEARWFDADAVRALDRHEWIDRVIADALRASRSR